MNDPLENLLVQISERPMRWYSMVPRVAIQRQGSLFIRFQLQKLDAHVYNDSEDQKTYQGIHEIAP